MTELRTSELDLNRTGIDEEPAVLFGRPVPSLVGQNERWAGVTESLGQGLRVVGWGYAVDQFATIADFATDPDSQRITPEQYDTLRGELGFEEAQVPFDPSITERQLRNRVSRARRDEYLSTIDRSVGGSVAMFGGAIAGSVLAPESLAAIPFGGPAGTAALRVRSGMDAFRLSVRSGAQMTAPAAGLNILAQQQTYGEVDAMEFAMNTVAPLIFTPPTVAFGRVFSKKEAAAASEALSSVNVPQRVPPRPDRHTPEALREQFADFEGGVEGWIGGLARGDTAALDFARARGLSEDALRELRDVSVFESSRTPMDEPSVRDFDALTAYAAGEPTGAQIQWLLDRGMAPQAERLRGAQRTEGFARPASDLVALRDISTRRAEVTTQFPELAGALRWADFMRAGGRTDIPAHETRQVAQAITRAVEQGDPNIAPAEVRGLVDRLIEASRADPATRRIAYAQEGRSLDAARAAAEDSSPQAQQRFAREVLRDLPEEFKADWEAFRTGGLEAVQVRYAARLQADAEAQIARLGAMTEGRRGRPTKAVQAQKARVAEAQQALDAMLARMRETPVREPRSVSVAQVADILNAARMQRPIDPAPPQAGTASQAPVRDLTEGQMDALVAQAQAYARANGVDPTALTNRYAAAVRHIRECEI